MLVKGTGKWLYRALDKYGDTLDFLLSAKHDSQAAKRFFQKTLNARHSQTPRVINVDQHAAYPPAMAALQQDKILPPSTELRQNKSLNNVIEQEHRFLQRRIKPGLGFKSFNTARRTIKGYEAMHLLRKGQVSGVPKGDVLAQLNFMAQVLSVAVLSWVMTQESLWLLLFLQQNPFKVDAPLLKIISRVATWY